MSQRLVSPPMVVAVVIVSLLTYSLVRRNKKGGELLPDNELFSFPVMDVTMLAYCLTGGFFLMPCGVARERFVSQSGVKTLGRRPQLHSYEYRLI